MSELPGSLVRWVEAERGGLEEFAAQAAGERRIVFVGSGPAHGAARFAAAKAIEAAGLNAWGQDVEEWAHLEYFCNPPSMLTWLLSCQGRSTSREAEVMTAAERVGRQTRVSQWAGGEEWPLLARESLSPLALWVGPTLFAARAAEMLGEEPFRGFRGGRRRTGGGGISRIRTSRRYRSVEELRRG
jgi:glucosamine--fructose-6-phosphate aminotransferase (isomerizing)